MPLSESAFFKCPQLDSGIVRLDPDALAGIRPFVAVACASATFFDVRSSLRAAFLARSRTRLVERSEMARPIASSSANWACEGSLDAPQGATSHGLTGSSVHPVVKGERAPDRRLAQGNGYRDRRWVMSG
jgi:hypothetical protein